MVPKAWINKLLLIKLLSLSISLANELKLMQTTPSEVCTFEDELDQTLNEMKTIQRVSQLSQLTRSNQDAYVEELERIEAKNFKKISKNQDFESLIKSYKSKSNFNMIKFINNSERWMPAPIDQQYG
jgi:hypothetical protein